MDGNKNCVAPTVGVKSNISQGKRLAGPISQTLRGSEMKVIATANIFTLLALVSFPSDRSIQVRDQYGNVVETKEKQWDETTFSDRYGNITRTERYAGQGRKTIRGKQRNLVGTEKAG